MSETRQPNKGKDQEEQKEIIKQKQHIFQKHYETFSDLINEMKSTKTKLEFES